MTKAVPDQQGIGVGFEGSKRDCCELFMNQYVWLYFFQITVIYKVSYRACMKNTISLQKSADTTKQTTCIKTGNLWGLPGKLSSGLTQIILLFLVSRGVLTIVGVLSTTLLRRITGGRLEWDHPSYSWLDIWGQWDTGWYLDISNNWYSAEAHFQHFCNYAFFPLYPTLIKLLGAVIGNHYYAGLIISNVALLGAAILLYKLVELDHDQEVALRSVKYMFIWPTSFLLSGVLSEALFLTARYRLFLLCAKGCMG